MSEPHAQLLFYGEVWALTEGVRSMTAREEPGLHTEVVYSLAVLESALLRHPGAGVVLCLCPHRNVVVLDRLRPLLSGCHVRVLSETDYWSDRTVLDYLGYGELNVTVRLSEMLRGRGKWEGHPLETLVREVENGTDEREKRLPAWPSHRRPEPGVPVWIRMVWLVQMIRDYGRKKRPGGMSGRHYGVLCQLSEGDSVQVLSAVLGIQEKTVSTYRREGLKLLGMEEKGGYVLYHGIQVREELQREPDDSGYGPGKST